MGIDIQAELARAEVLADAYRIRKQFEEDQAHRRWTLDSHNRERDNGLDSLLGKTNGRIDDTYMAEVPLTIGWNQYEDGVALAYVSLGGVDVSSYLPPDVMADIRRHIELEDEQ